MKRIERIDNPEMGDLAAALFDDEVAEFTDKALNRHTKKECQRIIKRAMHDNCMAMDELKYLQNFIKEQI